MMNRFIDDRFVSVYLFKSIRIVKNWPLVLAEMNWSHRCLRKM